MTAGVGAKVPRLLLSVSVEYVEAGKAGRPMNLMSIREDDPRIQSDPWFNAPGV